jgi:hypothetical protein
MVSRTPRLLVKTRRLPAGTAFAVSVRSAKVPFRVEPLFPAKPRRGGRMGAAAEPEWHLTDVPTDIDEVDLWELCYQLQSKGMGLAGGPSVDFAEPDLQQQWIFNTPDEAAGKAFRATVAANACEKPDPADSRYPAPNQPDWRWYQGAGFSGLDGARSQIHLPDDSKDRVTIAHLDTGYRKGHSVLPQFLDLTLQHSFVNGDPDPNDASDPNHGGFSNNPGHGTGTISILAGSMFDGKPFHAPSGVVGGAPFARVIPVRVADSVVSFANSAIARGIGYAIDNRVDVLSMSMGGVPAQVWVDLVNQAYEAGVVLVTAAGNNFGIGKARIPRFIVYPARFQRVLAACGVMFDLKPYADFLNPKLMGGCYGPDSKMDTAMAAFTPNTAWAKYACPAIVDFDGAGTSAATPQLAAAAACWLQKNRAAVAKYPQKWMRVEAARQAVLSTAKDSNREHFGRGTLRAAQAIGVAPAAASALQKTAPDSIEFPVLGGIFHDIFGVAGQPSAAQRMLRLETAQIAARRGEIQAILINAGIDPDRPPADIPLGVRSDIAEAMMPYASPTLRAVLSGSARAARPMTAVEQQVGPSAAEAPPIPAPPNRKLRVFAFDPALRMELKTESLAEGTLEVPWETNLQPGPVGEYLEVVDVDPSSNACYAPLDLNHPHILASEGLDPAEGVPQFHQQMVYAVAMTTIGCFERALGRTALWAPYIPPLKKGEDFRSYYVQRLRIYPHALREANAFYSPPKKSLLFGYFQARQGDAGVNLPGGLVFGCLSHDVVAHETTHALVDGLHRYYQYQTNPDIAAFHEAFADIVALFQHFTMPEALRSTIARSRGALGKENLLAQLAQQFGQATSGSRALRSALGKHPAVTDYDPGKEPHDLGSVLVAAVFQGFLEMYEARVQDLKRLATGGSGVLPAGDISVDLVNRMANEASVTAGHVLTACIRALDYCPPVDLTFGDFLRALITADMDISPEDSLNYRTAFISGFRARGIFPEGVRNLSEENLRWGLPKARIEPEEIHSMLSAMDLSWNLFTNRRASYKLSEENGKKLWNWLKRNLGSVRGAEISRDLGVYLTAEAVEADTRIGRLKNVTIPLGPDKAPRLEIHSVRPARRIDLHGQAYTDLVIEAVQKFSAKDPDTGETTWHRGGCTLLIDLHNERIRYAIRKRVGNAGRIDAERRFLGMAAEGSQSYFIPAESREPFAMLHRGL